MEGNTRFYQAVTCTFQVTCTYSNIWNAFCCQITLILWLEVLKMVLFSITLWLHFHQAMGVCFNWEPCRFFKSSLLESYEFLTYNQETCKSLLKELNFKAIFSWFFLRSWILEVILVVQFLSFSSVFNILFFRFALKLISIVFPNSSSFSRYCYLSAGAIGTLKRLLDSKTGFSLPFHILCVYFLYLHAKWENVK